MDFGLYLEFASREGVPQKEVFRESFALVDEAERLGVDSMWLAEYTVRQRQSQTAWVN